MRDQLGNPHLPSASRCTVNIWINCPPRASLEETVYDSNVDFFNLLASFYLASRTREPCCWSLSGYRFRIMGPSGRVANARCTYSPSMPCKTSKRFKHLSPGNIGDQQIGEKLGAGSRTQPYNGPGSAQKRGRWPRPNYHSINPGGLGSQIGSKIQHFEMVVKLGQLGSELNSQFASKAVSHQQMKTLHLFENFFTYRVK